MDLSNRERHQVNKLVIPTQKPRNHLIALVKFRKGGAHVAKKRVARNDQRKLEA